MLLAGGIGGTKTVLAVKSRRKNCLRDFVHSTGQHKRCPTDLTTMTT